MSVRKTVAENIRILRTERGLSQEELASALFVTRQTVSNYETGRSAPDLDTLQRVCAVLGVSLSDLMNNPPPKPAPVDSRLWLFLGGGCVLAVLTALGCLYTAQIKPATAGMPHILLRLTLVPLSMMLLGNGIAAVVLSRHPGWEMPRRYREISKGVLCGFLGASVICSLPYILWIATGLVQRLWAGQVAMILPFIPIYTPLSRLFLGLTYRFPSVFLLVGMGLMAIRIRDEKCNVE